MGLPIEDRDRLLTAIEHAVRDRTTPSVEVRTKAIELSTRDEQGRPLYVVVVEVPPSLNAPHMASHVFYRRGDRTSSKMDYMEIRRAFSQRGDLVRGMRERLRRRIEDLKKGYGPTAWIHHAGFVLYAASLPTYEAARTQVLAPDALDRVPRLMLFPPQTWRTSFFADGIVASPGPGEATSRFTAISHEGELFLASSPLYEFLHCHAPGEEPRCLRVKDIQDGMLTALAYDLPKLVELGFAPPFYLGLALVRARGFVLQATQEIDGLIDPFSERRVSSPFLLFDQLLTADDVRVVRYVHPRHKKEWRESRGQMARVLQPVLDRLWQAAGATGSPLVHPDG